MPGIRAVQFEQAEMIERAHDIDAGQEKGGQPARQRLRRRGLRENATLATSATRPPP